MDAMTLDDFRDYVLFKIMDCELDRAIVYLAVDEDGQVYGYATLPRPDTIKSTNGAIHQWMTEKSSDIIQCSCVNENPVIVQFPDNIKWTECMWKI